jgi:hypothetical protein
VTLGLLQVSDLRVLVLGSAGVTYFSSLWGSVFHVWWFGGRSPVPDLVVVFGGVLVVGLCPVLISLLFAVTLCPMLFSCLVPPFTSPAFALLCLFLGAFRGPICVSTLGTQVGPNRINNCRTQRYQHLLPLACDSSAPDPVLILGFCLM